MQVLNIFEAKTGAFKMRSMPSEQLLQLETTCGSLLYELQVIYDHTCNPYGVFHHNREKMLIFFEISVDMGRNRRTG